MTDLAAADPLSQAQLRVLRLVVKSYRTRGRPPTVRELARATGRNVNTVYERLKILRRKGYLSRAPQGSHNAVLAGARLVCEFTPDAAGARLRSALQEDAET